MERIEKIRQEAIRRREEELKNRDLKIKEWFENLEPFDGDVDRIPMVPSCNEELYQKYVIPNLIRCGAIPKEELEVGTAYLGDCRNASKAIWNGKVFTYRRTKFGYTYDEDINHFQDDDGYDVFVPIKKIENEHKSNSLD